MKRTHELSPLPGLDLLSDCSIKELKSARSLLTLLTIPAGEVVLRENSVGREFMIVVDGTVSVTRGTGEETEMLGTVGEGGIIGEMALLNNTPRSATITTATPTT